MNQLEFNRIGKIWTFYYTIELIINWKNSNELIKNILNSNKLIQILKNQKILFSSKKNAIINVNIIKYN
jgi:hypothetical protein